MPKLPKFLEIKEDDTEEEKKKKKFLAILFIILFFLVFVGIILGIVFGVRSCSRQKGGSQPDPTPSGPSDPGTPSEPVVIDYLTYALNDGGETYRVTGLKSNAPYDIVIPDTYEGKPVTAVGYAAFRYCGIKTVEMTDNITYLDSLAFYGCSQLTSVKLSNNIVSTGYDCFKWCSSLTTINIPNSLTDAQADIFDFCTSLPRNEYKNGSYIGNDEIPYMFLIDCIDEEVTSFEVSDQCRYMAMDVFDDCNNLSAVTIPDSVTKIGPYCFQDTGLSSITLPSHLTFIGMNAFMYCPITSVVVPDSVTYLGEGAFQHCESLTSVQIGKGVTSLDDFLLDGCTSLSSFTIPKNIVEIRYKVFNGCGLLTEVNYEGTMEEWGEIEFDEEWCTSSLTVVHCSNGDVPVTF